MKYSETKDTIKNQNIKIVLVLSCHMFERIILFFLSISRQLCYKKCLLTESVYSANMILTESVDELCEVSPLEKFLNLPVEKQKTIIDAALKSFGANGYKKTSVSDIAAAAGISKAMVFHYFGTKKALYFYLIELCGNIIINEVKEKFDDTVSDFFERIRLTSSIELAAMKKHPGIPAFITSVYLEKDEEVKDDIKALISQGDDFRNKIALHGIDYSKFKDSIDIKLLMKMLLWLTDGYINQISDKAEFDYDLLLDEFNELLDMLKNNFYKEEYVDPEFRIK